MAINYFHELKNMVQPILKVDFHDETDNVPENFSF